MKGLFAFLLVLTIGLVACSGSKHYSAAPQYIIYGGDTLTDSLLLYEIEFEARQHSDFDKLIGTGM